VDSDVSEVKSEGNIIVFSDVCLSYWGWGKCYCVR